MNSILLLPERRKNVLRLKDGIPHELSNDTVIYLIFPKDKAIWVGRSRIFNGFTQKPHSHRLKLPADYHALLGYLTLTLGIDVSAAEPICVNPKKVINYPPGGLYPNQHPSIDND